MTKNINSITDPKLKLEILTPQEVQKIHEATLHIIENVGIRFPSKRAMDRRPYNVWEEKQDNADDWALEKAREILSTHQPDALDPNISKEMAKIISSLEK